MRFLLDTNAVIALLRGDRVLRTRIRQHRPADFGLPSLVVHELYFGAYKSRNVAENLADVDGLRFEVLEFDVEDARASGQMRAALSVRGTPIGPVDVLIAGQAMARDLTLITRNTGEFSRVAGLRVVDWESEGRTG